MPSTPQINIPALKKMGILDEDKFYRLLSDQCNYIDPKTVKDVFYAGFVRAITKELRVHGVVRLPHIGFFYLLKQKDKMGWAGKFQGILKGKCIIKFYATESWRKYFAKYQEGLANEAAADPRSKVLKQNLMDLTDIVGR